MVGGERAQKEHWQVSGKDGNNEQWPCQVRVLETGLADPVVKQREYRGYCRANYEYLPEPGVLKLKSVNDRILYSNRIEA